MIGVAAICAFALGCQTPQGQTTFRIKVDDVGEQKAIRRELWRASKAVEDVRVKYGLTSYNVQIVVTDSEGLGSAMPTLSPIAVVKGARIVLSKLLFLSDHPEIDQIMVGMAAHEMAHAMHYTGMSRLDLLDLGRRYNKALNNPDGPQVAWVRTYERMTDMTAIALGYGDELIWQKRASAQNLALNEPKGVWDFYLTEDEIRAYMADRKAVRDAITASLEELNLPSLRRFRDRLRFDEDGDVILRP